VSGDALTALVEKWQERSSTCQSRVELLMPMMTPSALSNRQVWEACGIEIRKCADELAAAINAQLDKDIAHDWEIFEAGRQHGLAHGPSVPPPAPKAPVA
jgi:hypothetical protein